MSEVYRRRVEISGTLRVCKPDRCVIQNGKFEKEFAVTAESLAQAHFKLNELLQNVCDGREHGTDRYETIICNGFRFLGGFSEPESE